MGSTPRWVKVALVAILLAGGALAVVELWPRPANPNPSPGPAARTADALLPEPCAVAAGVYILGEMAPGAAYAVDTSAGLVLIDTGLESGPGRVTSQLTALGLGARPVRAILLTHMHADHSLGAEGLRAATGAPVYAGRGDSDPLREGRSRDAFFSTFYMPQIVPHPTTVDVELVGDEVLDFGDSAIRVIAAPGHTPGSVCYLLERPGLRALFTGDVVQHLSTATPGALGTYAARLAPKYRGNAREYRASLARLRELPRPDLVLPGHPRMDPSPQDPRVSAEAWLGLIDRGIAEMDRVLARFAADGEDFLDGTPKELLPGLHYLGDLDGAAVYAAAAPAGVFLFDAPGGARLAELMAERAKLPGWKGAPTAVVLTSAGGEGVTGLPALVRATGCRVYAPAAEVEAVRKICPDQTRVLPATDLETGEALPVTVIPLRGLGTGPTAYRLKWAGKTVLISGRTPGNLANGQIALDLLREVSAVPGGPAEYLQSVARLARESPDLWLPAVPVHGQNANLYDSDWASVLGRNQELFRR